jgi:hypothetical protein
MPRVLTPLATAAVLRALRSADLDISLPSDGVAKTQNGIIGWSFEQKAGGPEHGQ